MVGEGCDMVGEGGYCGGGALRGKIDHAKYMFSESHDQDLICR